MSDGFDDKPKISTTRWVLWVVVGGIGLYLVGTGLYGVFTRGA